MASDAQSWHDVDEGATRPSTVDSVVQIPDSIASRLTIARRELLDPSLRNPLLNYRSLKARGVEIVGETLLRYSSVWSDRGAS